MKKRFIRSRCNGGSALVIVVFVLMVLSFLVLRFAQGTLQFQGEEGDEASRIQAKNAARSGLEYVLSLLESGKNESSAGEEILGENRFVFRVVNEEGKLDLNSLVDGDGNLIAPQAEGIARYLDSEGWGEEKKEFLDQFADWIDADSTKRERGAEQKDYSGIRVRNGVFQTAAELRLLPSVGSVEKAQRLRRGLTVYSSGKVNVNSASEKVLMALSPRMTEPVARGIVKMREKKPFQSVAQLKDVLGMNELLLGDLEERVDVRGKYYTVAVTGICGKAEVRLGAVAKRTADGIKLVQVKEPLLDEDLFCVD